MAADGKTLEGKVALVTGATSGIGKAAALQLAREGAKVIIHGRDSDRGSSVVDEIKEAGGDARFVQADLTDITEVRQLADSVGDIDVLVNNAGLSWFGPTADLDVDTFDAMFDANVRAPYFLTAAIAPKMVANGGGSIINVGSMAGQVGLAGGAAYSGTKATLAAMTRAWAAEFSPAGVRVNTVAPGPVHTGTSSGVTETIGETTLFKRAAQAEEIAEVITFLASPRASYVTGANIAVDAGRTAI
jgi:NAD(P)-dependent dehydrogenase (short-subunit alcohol dehydrogenase family)